MQDIRSAGLYTDFAGLAELRTRAAATSTEDGAVVSGASEEVAQQFEALFLQHMLKAMRDASQFGEGTDSDQTKFYQEMFDKQIAIDLASRGEGVGLARMLRTQLNPAANTEVSVPAADDMNSSLVRAQLAHAARSADGSR